MQYIQKLMGLFCVGFLLLLLLADMSPASELIQPTRTLDGEVEESGSLTVLSEPPALAVMLDDTPIGKTPVFLDSVKPGVYSLRVKGSKTTIEVKPAETLRISLFKGKFINVPLEEKEPVKQQTDKQKAVEETPSSRQAQKAEQKKDLTPWDRYIDGSSKHF